MHPDWIELLQSLEEENVEFVVIGAAAVAFHGMPRMTGDFDLLFDRSPTNTERLWRALARFGAPVGQFTASDFEEEGSTFAFGHPPGRIDLLNWLSGSDWEMVSRSSVVGELAGMKVRFIGLEQLLANKEAAGRDKDIADLKWLRREAAKRAT